MAQAHTAPGRDPAELVAAHVRRLGALRRASIVERLAGGIWQVPSDLPERVVRQHDMQRLDSGVAVELESHLPIERQARVIGATWLDQQLIAGGQVLGELGFGSEVRSAPISWSNCDWQSGAGSGWFSRATGLRHCASARLRRRHRVSRQKPAWSIARWLVASPCPAPTGPASSSRAGHFAMLDYGLGFTLLPWKPVIEKRLG